MYLYRHYSKKGTLLYIGITNNLKRRVSEHSKKHWYDSSGNFTYQKCKDRKDALRKERKAIISEKPRYNIIHNKGKKMERRNRVVDTIILIAFILAFYFMMR